MPKLAIFITAYSLISGCDQSVAHRQIWELDPQGQSENLAATECAPPRVPYYIYPDGSTPFYLECLRPHTNE